MKITYNNEAWHYFDINGIEIHDGDTVFMDGKPQKVFMAEDGELGTDATNPVWIEKGKAVEGEYGIYPFSTSDSPVLVKEV